METVPQGWAEQDKKLVRTFKFDSFAAAIGFIVEVALFCDKTDHHPEWRNLYDKVYVELTTHDAGGITDKDIALAKHMNKVFGV